MMNLQNKKKKNSIISEIIIFNLTIVISKKDKNVIKDKTDEENNQYLEIIRRLDQNDIIQDLNLNENEKIN